MHPHPRPRLLPHLLSHKLLAAGWPAARLAPGPSSGFSRLRNSPRLGKAGFDLSDGSTGTTTYAGKVGDVDVLKSQDSRFKQNVEDKASEGSSGSGAGDGDAVMYNMTDALEMGDVQRPLASHRPREGDGKYRFSPVTEGRAGNRNVINVRKDMEMYESRH